MYTLQVSLLGKSRVADCTVLKFPSVIENENKSTEKEMLAIFRVTCVSNSSLVPEFMLFYNSLKLSGFCLFAVSYGY